MNQPPSLREAVAHYLRCRRQLGFALKKDGMLLASLVRYAKQRGHRGPLTAYLALNWAKLPRNAHPSWWASRLETVHRFARFWVAYDPRTQIPPTGVFGAARYRRCVHIYTRQEVRALLQAAQQLGPTPGWRGSLYRTLLGLLACTGLRISEALALTDQDVDCQAGLLTVRRAKGGQTRCLPLHASAASALQAYRQARQRIVTRPKDPFFFLTVQGTAPAYSQVAAVFRSLCNRLGWTCKPWPRLHDLRHTFAVNWLIHWHQHNEDVGKKVLALSAYLGHRQVSDTYWYLSAVPQLLRLSGQRLETGITAMRAYENSRS